MPTKKPLGEVMVEQGYIKREDLEKALELQAGKMAGESIGSILLGMDVIGNTLLDNAILIQSAQAGLIPEEALHPRKMLLGEILIEHEVINSDQLAEALDKQKTRMSGFKIGKILVKLGYCAKAHIYDARLKQSPDIPTEDLFTEVFGQPETADLLSIERPYIKLPDIKWPTITIGIMDIYGCGSSLRGGMLAGVRLFREPNESNEALAERAGQAIKDQVLKGLDDMEYERERFENR